MLRLVSMGKRITISVWRHGSRPFRGNRYGKFDLDPPATADTVAAAIPTTEKGNSAITSNDINACAEYSTLAGGPAVVRSDCTDSNMWRRCIPCFPAFLFFGNIF